MKKINLIAIALLLVSSVAFAQDSKDQTYSQKQAIVQKALTDAQNKLADAKTAAVKAQIAYDAADAKSKAAALATWTEAQSAEKTAQAAVDAAQLEAAKYTAQSVKILGTWLCDGSSKETRTRANAKQKAESDKKKKNEENIEVTLEKVCNDEPTGLSHGVLKSIPENLKFITKGSGELQTSEMNPKYFPADWSCSKPTLKVVNTFFVRLQERDNVEVDECLLTANRISELEWDANKLENFGDWTVKVGEKSTGVKQTASDTTKVDGDDLNELDADALWRKCKFTCSFVDYSILTYIK
jgi:hypothetical protein